jgi:4-amino-4-deoxy-L-arabinose transferase-like glycosyltransferase
MRTSPLLRTLAWALALSAILWSFLPKLTGEGYFLDGMTYAVISRNLAEGYGSFWKPVFGETFWNPYSTGSVYYDNPPLYFWIEALFFKILGDAWWVERVFNGCLVIAHLFLVRALWRLLHPQPEHRWMAWLPVLLCCVPALFRWGFASNLYEALLSVFALAGLALYLHFTRRRAAPLVGSLTLGALVVVAGLTKGLVALYPLTVPFFYHLAYQPRRWRAGFGQSALATGVVGLAFAALLVYEPSRHYFDVYWNQQVLSALAGKREVAEGSGLTARLYLLGQLVFELRGVLVLTGLALGWLRMRRRSDGPARQAALFFGLVALSASLPLLVSPKQYGHYNLPSLSLYVLALASLIAPALADALSLRWVRRWAPLGFATLSVLALVGTGYYLQRGWHTRSAVEEAYLHDTYALKGQLPEHIKIAVHPAQLREGYLHTFLGRYFHDELIADSSRAEYFILMRNEPNRPPFLPRTHYERVPVQTDLFRVYHRVADSTRPAR